jgi:protein CWC15
LTATEREVLADVLSHDADVDVGEEGGGEEAEDEAAREEAELRRELERVRAERAEEKRRREEEERKLAAKEFSTAAAASNPLLAASLGSGAGASAKRRWDEDVLFRNQASSEGLGLSGARGGSRARFINDPLRNDFHRKFMSKYIQ